MRVIIYWSTEDLGLYRRGACNCPDAWLMEKAYQEALSNVEGTIYDRIG